MKTTKISFGIFALALMFASSSAFAQSSVSDDGAAANNLVSAAATSASSGAVASIIAGAVSGAISPPTPVGPVVNLDNRFSTASKFNFNSRALTGKSAGRSPRAGFWVQGGYTLIDNNEDGGKFDGNAVNVLVGLDYKPAKFNGKMVVGISGGYENIDIDTEFNNGTFEGSGFTVTPYIGYTLSKNWAISALAGVGFIDYENSRTNGAVKGDFDALRAYGSVNLAGNYFKKRWRLSPKIGVLGLWEEQDSYNETGTSTAAVGRTSIHNVKISGGLEIGYRFKKLEPFVSAIMQYDADQNSAVTLTNGQVASEDDLAGVFGAGLNINGKKVVGQVKYETQQLKNELQTHTFSGRIRFNF